MNEKKSKYMIKKTSYFVALLGMSACCLFLAGLAFFSILVTYSNGWGYRLRETLEKATLLNAPLMVVETVIGVGLLVLAMYTFLKAAHRISERQVLSLVCVLAVLFQLWWVLSQNCDATWYQDAKTLLRWGRQLAAGDYTSFDTAIQGLHIKDMKEGTRYLVEYPYQSGILVYFYGLFRLFGNQAPLAIQIINLMANTGSIVMLSLIGFLMFPNSRIRKLIPVLLGFCLPLLLYATFLYGNQLGFFFTTCFLYLHTSALKTKQKRKKLAMILLSLIPMTLMMWIKSTYILFVLAIVLLWFLDALHEWRRLTTVCFVASLFVMMAAATLQNVPAHYMEAKLGYEFGKGMPKTAWIAIGLENESVLGDTMPGWWNGNAIRNQDETNNDYEEQVTLSLESIGQNLRKMVTHPRYGLWFLTRKLGTEWLTPDFQSFYFAGINYKMSEPGVESGAQLNLYERDMNVPDEGAAKRERLIDQLDSLRGFMDGYQSFIYIFAFWGCARILKDLRKKKNGDSLDFSMLLTPCAFLVGGQCTCYGKPRHSMLSPSFCYYRLSQPMGLLTL